jgi:8-oxo-dGTP diphosphatase
MMSAPPSEVAPRVRVVAGVVFRDGEVLLTQRPPTAEHAGQWEFPGGKIEPGETPEQAVVREIREELGVGATPRGVLDTHSHDYESGTRVEIVFIACDLDAPPRAASPAVHAMRWERPDRVDASEILAADRPFLARLAEMLRAAREEPSS